MSNFDNNWKEIQLKNNLKGRIHEDDYVQALHLLLKLLSLLGMEAAIDEAIETIQKEKR